MDEGSAYSSKLTLHFGTSSGPTHPRPGTITDADDERLRTLKDTVALPVVTSLLSEEELHSSPCTGASTATPARSGSPSPPPGRRSRTG